MGKRLFVSVDLDGLADAVRAVQEPFADTAGLRLMDPEQAHVTLKFLGETDTAVDDIVAELETAVAEVRKGDRELTALHEAIEDRTTAMGFDAERHDFTPHATIARMDHAGGKERVQDIVESEDPDVGRLRVEAVRLTHFEAEAPSSTTLGLPTGRKYKRVGRGGQRGIRDPSSSRP